MFERSACLKGSYFIWFSHTMDLLWDKFHWILPLYMKPISFQSNTSVVYSVNTTIFIVFCLKKLNVFSQHIYYWFRSLHCIYQLLQKKHSIATITKLRSLELLIKTPLLHILYYINGLTHEFWTQTGGWEFDRSHGAGTSSPSHWQQVEEQAPKPVGWTMCFLLMTLVPVQKLCVNMYVYICVYSLYEFCYRSYIQRECHSVLAKLHPITFYRGVRGSWSECHFVFSLVYQLCLALW